MIALRRGTRIIAVTIAAVLMTFSTALADVPILSASDASTKVAAGEIILLDIRTPQEWGETGLADGAWPVSMHSSEFPQQLRTILTKYEPDQIALICATGGRTAYVAEVLEKNGITGVADVSEGMMGNGRGVGWIASGLPLITTQQAMARFDAAMK